MKVIIPPPLIGLACGAAIWALSAYGPVFEMRLPGQIYAAYTIMAIGLLIDAVSVAAFIRAKTTVSPLSPEKSRTLVVTGLYKISRNPMYLGMLLILIGYMLLKANMLALPIVAFFVFYITQFQIKPEEARLAEIFGEPYLAYKRRVRRWL